MQRVYCSAAKRFRFAEQRHYSLSTLPSCEGRNFSWNHTQPMFYIRSLFWFVSFLSDTHVIFKVQRSYDTKLFLPCQAFILKILFFICFLFFWQKNKIKCFVQKHLILFSKCCIKPNPNIRRILLWHFAEYFCGGCIATK